MSITAALIIFIAAFSASFIQRVTGFGFGIMFMTVAPYLLPSYGEATALSGSLAVVCAIVAGIQYRRSIPWKKLLPILVTFLVVSFFAVYLVSKVDSRSLKHYLGAFLILVSLYFLFINGRFRMNPSVPVQVGMGTLSGLTGGLFGMQGPPAVIYFISCTDNKEEYMAITQWFFIIGNTAMTLYRAGNGFLTPLVGTGWLVGVGAVLLGLFLGSKIYNRIPMLKLRKAVYVFIGVSGVVALFA